MQKFTLMICTVVVFACGTGFFAPDGIAGKGAGPAAIQIDRDGLGLTPAEADWLRTAGPVRMAGPKSFPPFHYYDKKGELKGISADYILTIMDQLGVAVEIRAGLPWSRVLEMARSGEVDLIPCIARSREREAFLDFSEPYLSFPLVIMTRKDAPFISGVKDLHGKKLCIIRKNVIADWLARDNIRYQPHPVASPLAGLEAVSLGRADATIENMAAAGYLIQQYGLANLKIAAPTPYSNYDLHMAVRKDLPELLGIINKVLERISPDQHMAIRNRWLSVRYEYGISRADVLRWVFLGLLFFGSILAVVLIWNRKLNREIRERIQAETALGASEERFREMADLLPGAIVEMDRDLNITYVNRSGMELFGVKREDVDAGLNGLDFIHPDDRERLMERAAGLLEGKRLGRSEYRMVDKGRDSQWMFVNTSTVKSGGRVRGFRSVIIDITHRKQVEQEREELIKELRNALDEIQVLREFLPICASCKKIRDDQGSWHQVDEYIQARTNTRFSHGICPDCTQKLYPGYAQKSSTR